MRCHAGRTTTTCGSCAACCSRWTGQQEDAYVRHVSGTPCMLPAGLLGYLRCVRVLFVGTWHTGAGRHQQRDSAERPATIGCWLPKLP